MSGGWAEVAPPWRQGCPSRRRGSSLVLGWSAIWCGCKRHLHAERPARLPLISYHRPPTHPPAHPPRCRHLGLGSYAEWDEDARLAFLTTELQGRRPLIPPAMPFSPDAQEVVDTLK